MGAGILVILSALSLSFDSEESGGDEPLLNSGTVLQILHSACGFVQDDKGTNDNGPRTRHFRIFLNAKVL